MRVITAIILASLVVPVFGQPVEELKTQALYVNPESRTYLKEWLMLGSIPVLETVNELMEKGKFNPDENLVEPNIYLNDGSVWLGWDYYTEAMRNSLLEDGTEDSALRPTYGSNYAVAGKEFTWNHYESTGRRINFDPFFGRHENAIVYAYAEIEMSEPKEMNFFLRSDDLMMFSVNGEEVYRFFGGRGVDQGEDKVTVQLNEGVNTVLVKVLNMHLDWGFGVQVRDLNDVSVEEAIEGSLEGAIESIFADASVIWIPVGLFIMGFIILLTLFFVIRSKFGSGDRLHG